MKKEMETEVERKKKDRKMKKEFCKNARERRWFEIICKKNLNGSEGGGG